MIKGWGYNDYELIYLIKERSDEALEIMFAKYEKLIYTKIYKYYFHKIAFEDCVQEGRLVLLKALKLYSDNSKKTFMRYFELLLERKLIDLLRKDIKDANSYELSEEKILVHQINENSTLNNAILNEEVSFHFERLSKFEEEVYRLKFLRGYKVKEISKVLNLNPIKVSNAIQRIKKKL